MTTRAEWIAGARPKTLPAAIAPVLVATAFAGNAANLIDFSLALIIATGLQIGVNYANDYSDGIRGTDSNRVGPMRLVGSGKASAASVKRAALISIAIASVAGVLLAARSSWLLLLIGAVSIVAAWTYTGGPKPYGYFALGEISVFIFFGLVATIGTYFAQANLVSIEVILAAIAMGSLACSLLIVNNLRDRANDERSKKMTLAVRLGDRRTRTLYGFTLVLPLLIALVLAVNSPYYLSVIVILPLVSRAIKVVRDGEGAALIKLLAQTGKIQMLYAFSLSLAAILAQR